MRGRLPDSASRSPSAYQLPVRHSLSDMAAQPVRRRHAAIARYIKPPGDSLKQVPCTTVHGQEEFMEDPNRKPEGTPYKQMNPKQKLKFILKLAICILTFGIAFPNVMSD